MNINDTIIEGILTKLAGRAESNIKSGAKWVGKKTKEGLAKLGKKAAYGAGKLVGKGIAAVKKRMGEASVYDRIVDMLLEARIEDYLDRLDEARYESGKKIGPGPKKGGMSPEVKGAIRQDRFEKATGISPAKSEDARQKKHAETHGKGAPGRAIRARGRRQEGKS